MPSKKTHDQPDRIDPADAEAPTQQVPADAAAPTAAPVPAAAAPVQEPVPVRNRFAWVSSPKVAAATVITVFVLGALGGAFALGRATAGHDHGRRDVMVQMGVPGRPGFEGRGFGGFGRERFGGQVPMPGQQGQTFPEPDGQQPSAPTPSASADG